MGLCEIHGDNDTLAGGQAIGFNDDRRALFLNIGMGRFGIGKRFVVCRGHSMTFHKCLGKIFGTFQLSGGLCRSENLQVIGSEIIDNPCRQRSFRANHREAYVIGFDKVCQTSNVGFWYIDQLFR